MKKKILQTVTQKQKKNFREGTMNNYRLKKFKTYKK